MADDRESILTDLINQLKSAYRKFKTHTYYDNYSAINRAKIANFETNESLDSNDDFFEGFAEELMDKKKRKKLLKELSQNINVLCYPKSVKTKSDDDSTLGNIPEDCDLIEKLNYFIDLDVKAHILGTLWILRSGWVLDHRLHKNCHGNRINKEVLVKIKSFEKDGDKYLEPTTFLFEPYFKRYQVWRDKGLDAVEKLLENKDNAIMLSLDFKEYYYTSTINFKKLKNDIKISKQKLFENYHDNTNSFEIKLNEDLLAFIEKIFINYSKRFQRHHYNDVYLDEKIPMIPIGFLPSLIISNWNLQAFDQAILDYINPAYYGRYVDDMLIVFKSHPESESFSKEKLDVTHDEIIRKFFIPNSSDNTDKNNILKIIQKTDGTTDYGVNNLLEREFRYKMGNKASNSNRYLSIYSNLRIQSTKLKIFRFRHTDSKALIENFKKEIYRNSSEFRLMHKVEKLYADVAKNIFSIQYADSINKLGDIKSIKLNKFELSKTLSWLIRIAIYETDKVSKENRLNIIHAFSGSKKIEYMILWEKFIEFLYVENEFKVLKEEIEKILIKITKLSFKGNPDSTYNFRGDSEDLLKKSLWNFLYCTYIRVISLRNLDDDYKNILELFKTYGTSTPINFKIMHKNFVLSYLYKNSLMRDPLFLIEGVPEDFNFSKYNLINPDFLGLVNDKNIDENDKSINENFTYYPYYPRYVQFHEITVHILNFFIFNSLDFKINQYLKKSVVYHDLINGFKTLDNILDGLETIDTLLNKDNSKTNIFYKDKCDAIDFRCECKFIDEDDNLTNENDNPANRVIDVINTGNTKKSKVRIGLINTCLNKDYFDNALKGKPNRTSERLDRIADIINEAIDKKVELLVMPEVYIPYEWILGLLDISRTHNMAMVFGIEPIVNGKNVGNYIATALPSETESKHKNCILVMRLKNSYSPEELREYQSYSLNYKNNSSTNYSLCIWNDIYFVPYYCYEIANITDRALFKSCCDMVIVSEYNKDTAYFAAIAESLSRDLFCYCVKVNSSEFGGTCIIQPSKRDHKYLVNLKGGEKDYVVTHTIDVEKLRHHQIRAYASEIKNTVLKPKPPGFEDHRVRARMRLPSR